MGCHAYYLFINLRYTGPTYVIQPIAYTQGRTVCTTSLRTVKSACFSHRSEYMRSDFRYKSRLAYIQLLQNAYMLIVRNDGGGRACVCAFPHGHGEVTDLLETNAFLHA